MEHSVLIWSLEPCWITLSKNFGGRQKFENYPDYEPLPEFSILRDIVPATTFMPAKPLHLQVVLKDAITTCAGCAQEGCGYQRGSQCLRAWYCSVECQRRAWPDHKHICSRHSWEQGCHELPAWVNHSVLIWNLKPSKSSSGATRTMRSYQMDT